MGIDGEVRCERRAADTSIAMQASKQALPEDPLVRMALSMSMSMQVPLVGNREQRYQKEERRKTVS